ncbi:hypothetical protein ACFXJ8_16700 [Nonomuraea sp. NPDC059194]|uniref:hypothetical protein n=1 Tax=Nonomuraea sp. NPDC059194 TaxID=3346764 RepID=UPI00367B56F7
MEISDLNLRAAMTLPFRNLLELLDIWTFARWDRRAEAQGWTVVRPQPLVHVYRHHGFAAMVTCGGCEGEGVTRKGACHTCLGSGRQPP